MKKFKLTVLDLFDLDYYPEDIAKEEIYAIFGKCNYNKKCSVYPYYEVTTVWKAVGTYDELAKMINKMAHNNTNQIALLRMSHKLEQRLLSNYGNKITRPAVVCTEQLEYFTVKCYRIKDIIHYDITPYQQDDEFIGDVLFVATKSLIKADCDYYIDLYKLDEIAMTGYNLVNE